MSSEFGLRGPKMPWVCPNDRQLALRAKLKTGWSIKTSQFNKYPKPQPLTESEQQAIISVVKKAEELELTEQKRVGKLVDRLESLKKLASGNGVTECLLCGDSFGLSVFGRSNYRCCDCKKGVCRKCVVELGGGAAKDPVVRLCKICSENRELIKRSGAWFYKGVPKYILPDKKNHYRNNYESSSSSAPHASTSSESSSATTSRYTSRYLSSSHAINSSSGSKRVGALWSLQLSAKSEAENDSSSGDEGSNAAAASAAGGSRGSNKLHEASVALGAVNHNNSSSSAGESSSNRSQQNTKSKLSVVPPKEEEDGIVSSPSPGSLSIKQQQQRSSFERFESVGDQSVGDNNTFKSPVSSNEGFQGSSNSPSSQPQQQQPQSSSSSYGVVEVSLLYDDAHQALHCTVHKAKDLYGTDRNGLSDPYCMLRLVPSRLQVGHHRTKTIHKTLNPVFNETLTFYGLSQAHFAWLNLQISIIDDDRWARDCLGFTQIPLQRIRPQQTRSYKLNLEDGKLISGEDKEWDRGSLLLSLSYLSEKSNLIVGIVKAADLPALDHTSGVSDPFVKVRLIHDTNLTDVPLNSGYRKYKTGVKWRTLNPEFNDEFSFKVSIVDLPRLALVISVWDKAVGKNNHNEYIGGTMLSYGSKGERLLHWDNMMKLPNTIHSKWHNLSPTPVPVP